VIYVGRENGGLCAISVAEGERGFYEKLTSFYLD